MSGALAAGVRAGLLLLLAVPVPARGDVDARADRPPAGVADGAAITPEFARALYERLAPLRESDGCRLARFDTGRVRIAIGLLGPSGAEHAFELATAPALGHAGRTAGDWALAVPPDLEGECGATLAAIERILEATAAPHRLAWVAVSNHAILVATFVLLLLGTLHVLWREWRTQRPPAAWALALAAVWLAALALRLFLSPHTFLHEYYHIAETVPGYLTGEIGPAYGNTGPALFRLAGLILRRPQDVGVIFLTTAVIASLAIPAVALLDLALLGRWPRALCAGVLLAILPQHLRFSAAEDLFVHAVTFALWTLALFMLYVRRRRLEDALLAALALSLAVQTRPEMTFFPACVVALLLLTEPRAWRLLFAWRTLLALGALAVLLTPRALELSQALQAGSPDATLPGLLQYLDRVVLFQAPVTPPVYWLLLAVGALWTAWRRPGLLLWVLLVFAGYTLFSLSMFDNQPYNVRSQLLPNSFLVLIAAGAAAWWMDAWGARRRAALGLGAAALAALSAAVLLSWRGTIGELRDQQLEWAFLERTAPQLPQRGRLLTAVDSGGHNLDAFPAFLLDWDDKAYEMVDVRAASRGAVRWPAPGDDLLYYQGMFCYFAFDDEPPPDPMTPVCRAVSDRYAMEPLFVEELHTQGYSHMRYAGDGQGPFRIGFYRLRKALR